MFVNEDLEFQGSTRLVSLSSHVHVYIHIASFYCSDVSSLLRGSDTVVPEETLMMERLQFAVRPSPAFTVLSRYEWGKSVVISLANCS